MSTPLAWKNLTSSFGKFMQASTGVGFAVVLMFMQIGFRNALLDSNVQLIKLFDADLVIVSRARYNLANERRFSRFLLDRASAIDGVEDCCAVSIERTTARVRVEGFAGRSIRVVCVQLKPNFLKDATLADRVAIADEQSRALVDRRSKSFYGFALKDVDRLRQQYVELNERRLDLGDTFNLGTDFAHDGTLLMSERIFPRYFPWRTRSSNPLEIVDVGLVKIRDSRQLERIRAAIQQLDPNQIDVYSMPAMIARELRFWANNTPIGVIFGIGTIMGLVVGAIICYQIQFTDISDHMPELATLKAMGYSSRYFWSLILCQSLYLACIGFVPGFIVSFGLYTLLASASGLVMFMNFQRVGLVWLLTVAMCLVSGAIAIRKLFRADPASLF